MKLLVPIIVLVMITGTFVSYQKLPRFHDFVSSKINMIIKASPSPVAKTEGDLEEESEEEEEGPPPTEQEIMYGSVNLDDQLIEVNSKGFTPSEVKIKKGTTVIWTNKDKVKHTIVVDNGAQTPALSFGKRGAIVFSQTGTFSYHDNNENLKGTITVE